ncbi:zinc finger CCCH domain-containing protein 13-like, partial [Oncorhynchus masou masou]|uniref:zinc finger CCCH domain-containing protein 13-like n=1 Tax=Oncorhynchus masou masou TaxID=90313 RepID=UPI003183E71E
SPNPALSSIPPDADKLFEHDLGALNKAALSRRIERAGLLRNLGPCCKALCARRDMAIRRQLLKNEKGLAKQMYPSVPVVDSELFQLSMRLFKKTVAAARSNQPLLGPPAGPEKADKGPPGLVPVASPVAKPSTPQPPEMCVS